MTVWVNEWMSKWVNEWFHEQVNESDNPLASPVCQVQKILQDDVKKPFYHFG